MKRIITLMVLLMTGCAAAGEHRIDLTFDDPGLRPKLVMEDSIRIYFKHHHLVIEPKNGDDRVEIEDDGTLYVNDRRCRLSKKQTELAVEYFELAQSAMDKAEEIGNEAVKVGLKGAELGLKAVAGVFRMLLPGYGSEDFEKDMERDGQKVEDKAHAVEERAEALEALVAALGEVHHELRSAVPKLAQLGWF